MARFAMINDKKVINVIEADSKEIAESVTGYECVPAGDALVDLGYGWDGETFTAPVVPAVEEVPVE